MIGLAVRNLAARRLRSALTAIAILLGVAMIAGTYVQTDQIRTAFDDIEQSANQGTDVSVTPRTAFTSSFAAQPTLDARLVQRVRRVPGVALAEGALSDSGALVVRGRTVQPQYAPTIVLSVQGPPFDPLRVGSGRLPRAHGEVAVNAKLAADEHLRLGQRLGLTTRTGVQRVRLVGTFSFGNATSLGGATIVAAPLADLQAWYRRAGRVSGIAVAAQPGVAPRALARRIRAALPRAVEVKTGEQAARDSARDAGNAIGGFLTPLLLAFAGAALLVGAFIIFNTFSITVAERRREFALMRCVGATRGQILREVAAEALVLGVSASVAGLLSGLAFARLLGALFDAAGFGIPRSGMVLQPRTIVVALGVGIGVTLASALSPALRATRVAPVAALRDEQPELSPRARRRRRIATAAVLVGGLALLLQGLIGPGSGTSRMGPLSAGALLMFVGTAMAARYLIRPFAAAIGRPLERLSPITGGLARENAARNPARTAMSAAALMVGLGLVVFVAVLASGLKSSTGENVRARLGGAQLIVMNKSLTPLPAEAGRRLRATPGLGGATPMYVEQIQVNGRPVYTLTDAVAGIDPHAFARVYRFRWATGSGAGALARLAHGGALVERQFAAHHHVAVGDRFRVRLSGGGTAVLHAVGEYRDPQVIQGMMVDLATFHALSPAADPFAYYVPLAGGHPDTARAKATARRALAGYPTATVRTMDEYVRWFESRLDQIVYLLYALLAMSVVISLFGIANSLFLSIHERTRELGLLRAIGATAPQVRRIIRGESMITSLIGGLLGTVVGVLFAWLTTFALRDVGLGFHLPALQLVLFLALAVLVGWIGAMAPARRAARLDVLRAIGSE